MGLEPTTPCLQSQIGQSRHLASQRMWQVHGATVLSVAVRSGPIETAVNGTLGHGRRGGPVATASAVSRPVMTNQTVLGRRGPDRVCGHVCPECDTAIDEAGAIGQTAIRWAVITHVGRTSQTRAKRLRALLDEDFRPVLLAWACSTARRTASRGATS